MSPVDLILLVLHFLKNLNHSNRMSILVSTGTGTGADVTTNIIDNHDFSQNLENWKATSGKGFTVPEPGYRTDVSPKTGETFAVVTSRLEKWHGLEQDITGKFFSGSLYQVTAWVRISSFVEDYASVVATLRLEYPESSPKLMTIGSAWTKKGEWEKIEATFSVSPLPKRAALYFEGPVRGVDLLFDSVIACEILRETSARDGNIILNPEFEDGLSHWSARHCKINTHDWIRNDDIRPLSGNFFASVTMRDKDSCAIQQDLSARLQRRVTYEVTAVVRICGGNITGGEELRISLQVLEFNLAKYSKYNLNIIRSQVTNVWEKLSGTFVLKDLPSSAVIYFHGPPSGIDILVNNLVVKRAKRCPIPQLQAFKVPDLGSNIVDNSNFYDEKKMWFEHAYCKLEVRTGSPRIVPPVATESLLSQVALSGKYIYVTNRSQNSSGPAQKITSKLVSHLTYQVSAWVRLGFGVNQSHYVKVTLKLGDRHVDVCQANATGSRWHEISGSFRLDQSHLSEAMVYIHGPPSDVDFMVAGLHIFPVDRRSRFRLLAEKTEQIRKRDVVLKFHGTRASTLPNRHLKVHQISNSFPFGSSISHMDIDNTDFVNFFISNFSWAVCNEVKWSSAEPKEGNFSYSASDCILNWCKKNNIESRGHCIFEEVEDKVPQWVRLLNNDKLEEVMRKRLTSLLIHHKGKFKHYDVNNDILHGSFYKDRLGKDVQADMLKLAHEVDETATLFVNDYHIMDGRDARSSPEMCIKHICELKKQGAPIGGIGIQARLDAPIGPIICSALDKLSTLGLPVWFTELDVSSLYDDVKVEDLEVMLREGFAHPQVEGIMLSSASEVLMGSDFIVNQVGKKYIDLKKEWLSNHQGEINSQCEFRFRGFHGNYNVEIDALTEKICREFIVEKGSSKTEVIIHI